MHQVKGVLSVGVPRMSVGMSAQCPVDWTGREPPSSWEQTREGQRQKHERKRRSQTRTLFLLSRRRECGTKFVAKRPCSVRESSRSPGQLPRARLQI